MDHFLEKKIIQSVIKSKCSRFSRSQSKWLNFAIKVNLSTTFSNHLIALGDLKPKLNI